MDIEEHNQKPRVIDLEDSPCHGRADLVKLEAIEHSFSYISFDLFQGNSGKK